MRWPVIVSVFVVAALVAMPLAALAQPPEMQPSIMWGSLLGGATMYSNTGNFTLAGFERITAVFLPTPQNEAYYPYNPADGAQFWGILSAADGTQLARYDFWAQQRPAPYWVVDDMWAKNPATDESIETRQVPLPPGDYTVDFFLPTGRFYTFSFSVTKIDSDDPFRPQTYWFLEGPWRDWGCLTYADADPEQTLYWTISLRNKGREASKDAAIQIAITRDADGATVCGTRTGMSWTLAREWKSMNFEMVRPDQTPLRAADLLARDGPYTLRMMLDGEVYGTWKFRVAGGQLQYAGRTVRGSVDPLQFIEGGRTQWWYIRQESGQAPDGGAPTPGAQTGAAAGAEQATGATGAQAAGTPQVIPGATPIQVNGNTMVPLRSVFEWLGAEVKWIPQALSIYASRGDEIIVLMRLDEDEATVNGRKVPLPQRPVQQNGVTYVPLRFSAEAFGATVGFDAATGAITITDGDRVGLIPAG